MKIFHKRLVWPQSINHPSHNMKYVFVLFAFLFISQTSCAQLFKKEKVTYDANQGRGSTDNKLLRWGYFLGFSSYDFNFDYNDDLKDIYVKYNK